MVDTCSQLSPAPHCQPSWQPSFIPLTPVLGTNVNHIFKPQYFRFWQKDQQNWNPCFTEKPSKKIVTSLTIVHTYNVDCKDSFTRRTSSPTSPYLPLANNFPFYLLRVPHSGLSTWKHLGSILLYNHANPHSFCYWPHKSKHHSNLVDKDFCIQNLIN